MGNSTHVIVLVIVMGLMAVEVMAVRFYLEELSSEEMTAVAKLRKLVENELTAEYMKEDFYLAKWLAESGFNVDMALQKLRKHLLWRSQEKIDGILEENWEEMNLAFPYTRNTKDMAGRPLLYFDLGQWDIYKLVAEKDSLDILGRYFIKMLEESNQHVRRLRSQGDNVTQFSLIINMDGFSVEKHGCLQCLYFYRNIAQTLRAHFPRATERKVMVNVPTLFEMVYSFLGEETQKLLKVYGRDRNVWKPVILEYVERNQVPRGLMLEQVPTADNISILNHTVNAY